MNQDRYRRLKDLTQRALDLPAVERGAFLARECGGDEDLAREVRELLAQEDTGRSLAVNLMPDLPDLTGRTIGPYEILEPIGEGGMGVVYLAAQRAPLRRQVALKVIKLGMDTREVIARFDAERQALALMDHPNIAKVLDAGATDEGRPFFVMEHIQGVPLIKYCERRALGLRARLDLFTQVCRGIQHAHQKGVIHRDIKSGNILVAEVEGRAVPKIIDFGVAKAVGARLAMRTMFTQEGDLVGTPEYMSPEQADPTGVDVDTRSDVYSLGVVLYELLTGCLPLERRAILKAGLDGMGRAVRESTPDKPSTRLFTASPAGAGKSAASTGIDTRSWRKRVRGDLDWITMKALEKERERRYATPTALADDLLRHLANEPVTAGPPSRWYRMRKFARRNRVGVVMGLALLTVLVAGTVGTTIGMIQANRAEAVATAAANKAEAAVLYQISLAEHRPAHALSYALAALERDDKLDYRLQAKRMLLSTPPCWRLPDYEDGINPVAMDISPDGQWLAVGWITGAVQLYPFSGGPARFLVKPDVPPIADMHAGHIDRCVFSPDSRLLATSARDSIVKLWRPDDGSLVRTMKFDGTVRPFFSPDSDHLITVSRSLGGRTRWQAWPLQGGPPTELGASGDLAETFPCDLGPERRRLVQARGDSLFLYDLADLAAGPVRVIGTHDSFVDVVGFSPDARTVVSLSRNGHGRLWDLEAPGMDPTRAGLMVSRPQFVHFDAAGKKMAIGGIGGLGVWDLEASPAVAPLRLRGLGRWQFAGDIHPSGDWIVTVGDSREVAAWPLGGERALVLDIAGAKIGDMNFTPDGRHLVVAARNGSIWDLPLTGMTIGTPRLLHHDGAATYSHLMIDDESRYAFLSLLGGSETGADLIRVPLDGGEVEFVPDVNPDCCIDAPGRRVAFVPGEDENFVRIIDLTSGRIRDLDGPGQGFTSVSGFAADGRMVVGLPGGRFGLWDDDRSLFTPFVMGEVEAVWVAGDRHTLYGMDADYEMWRSSVDDSTWTPVPLDHSSYLFTWFRGATFDANLSYMVSGVHDEREHFLIWDMATDERHLYPLFADNSSWAVLDPDKRWIAATTAGSDGLIKVIRRPTGVPFETLPRDELLARLRALTNLRAVPDDEAKLGFSLRCEGIPDWGDPPTW